jgi:hypothetical protein
VSVAITRPPYPRFLTRTIIGLTASVGISTSSKQSLNAEKIVILASFVKKCRRPIEDVDIDSWMLGNTLHQFGMFPLDSPAQSILSLLKAHNR